MANLNDELPSIINVDMVPTSSKDHFVSRVFNSDRSTGNSMVCMRDVCFSAIYFDHNNDSSYVYHDIDDSFICMDTIVLQNVV